MILSKEVEIRVNSTTLKYYREKGYIVNMNDIIKIDVNDLTPSSFYKINVKCDICGKEKELSYHCYNKNIKKTGIYCCSNKCSYIKNKMTNLEKYGVENYHNTDKYEKTCLKKYGFKNVFQDNKIKDKIKETNLRKYGFESHNKNNIIKENKKNINLEKCGVNCNLNTDDQKNKSRIIKLKKYGNLNNYNKLKNTFMERYEVKHPSMVKEFKEKRIFNYKETLKKKFLERYNKLEILNVDFDNDKITINCCEGHSFEINNSLLKNRIRCNTKLCTICNPLGKHTSGQEILFSEYLKEICDSEIMLNTKKIINPNELDIYIPDLKLAFEFNGIYWHNELHRKKTYHKDKTELCENQGIRLIHVYEDDWMFKRDIVKSRILNIFKKSNRIFARKCEIKELEDNNLVRDFLNKNHLQGNINSKIKIGTFYNEELFSLMTFGSLRKSMGQKNSEGSYEMLRFCNKLNTNVVGGATRLFKYFLNKYNPIEITSYADRSWSKGNIYEKLGFEFVHKTNPNYYYIVDGVRKYRFGFRKDILIKEGFDPNKTEKDIMFDREIFRIYDSGNLKYIWKNN